MIERHIEKMKVAYPIASISGSRIDGLYGVKSFPSGALLDAEGRVIWMGHPGTVSRSMIEEALEGSAFVAPIPGEDYKKINKRMASQEYGAALKELGKALSKDPDNTQLAGAKQRLDDLLERRLASATAQVEASDFGNAMANYESLGKLFKGTDAEKDIKDQLKALGKNPAAKDELAAYKKMAKGDAAQRAGEFEKAAKAYAAIVKKYPDTKCAEQAAEFLERHAF